MEIKGPNLNSYPSNPPQISKDPSQLQTGQILKAVVANINNNKILLELIEPKLSVKLEAPGNSPLKLGQLVSLQVVKLGPPLSLNVLADPNALIKSDSVINTALRSAIPKQASMSQLLSNLQFLTTPKANSTKTYPTEIVELSRLVLTSLPVIKDVKTVVGIKAALNSSGLFLEQHLQAMLHNQTTLPGNDTRTSLLRLAESIRSHLTEQVTVNDTSILLKNKYPNNLVVKTKNQAIIDKNINFTTNDQPTVSKIQPRVPTNLTTVQQKNVALNELLRNIESSLAKIQYHQLQHFIPDEQSKTNWLFDLPVHHNDGNDIFHFKFTKDESPDNNKKNSEWSVILTFSLEKLGDVSIQIYLQNDKIGATVWAKENDTYNLFNQHISTLQQQMEKSGINISNIRCNKGEIPQNNSHKPKNLVDEKV